MSTKPVSPNTAKVYKGQLNRIAKETGISSLEGLKEEPGKVIAAITAATEAIEGVEKRNQARRLRYCAIFWALHDDPFLTQPSNPYRKAFHEADPLQTWDGTAWKKSYAFTE